jgi:hypothetical protein
MAHLTLSPFPSRIFCLFKNIILLKMFVVNFVLGNRGKNIVLKFNILTMSSILAVLFKIVSFEEVCFVFWSYFKIFEMLQKIEIL